jgi:PAS domain S-box-containing protein
MKKNNLDGSADLRKRAEHSLESLPEALDAMSSEEAKSLTHELRVHQIELEVQNEELRRVQNDLEISRSRYADLYDFAPVGYLSLDKNSQILDLNLTATRQLGIERGRLLNTSFHYFVCAHDRKEFLLCLNEIFHKRERRIAEVRLSPKEGDKFCARLEGVYLEGAQGAGLCRMALSDITLQKQAEQLLKDSHDALERCVDVRTAELQRAVAKLEALNHELQEFSFIASHDLQEPLRKIKAFGNILSAKHGQALNPEGQDYLSRIIKGADRMSELLRSLLAYSRAGTHLLTHTDVCLSEVAREAANDLELLVQKAAGRVEISRMPTIEGDPVLLRQLFQNLIANSMKYGKQGESPAVKIYANLLDCRCQVLIEDNGIGFEEEYIKKIFRPFEQLHGKNSMYGGTGMGLAICRKIVERHNGDITARSKLGKGATFLVRLPLKQEERG